MPFLDPAPATKVDATLSEQASDVRQRAEGLHGPARFPGAVICIRCDDIPDVDSSVVAPLLASRGLPATFAVIGNRVDTAGNQSTANLLALHAAGHELANHSWYHNPSGIPGTYAELQADTSPTDDLLAAMTGTPGVHRPETFVQPGGWTGAYFWDDPAELAPSSATGRWMRSRYSTVNGYVVPDKLPGDSGRSFPVRADTRIGGSSHMTITDLATGATATATAAIDNAILYGSQLTLLIHAWELNTSGKLTTSDLTTILDYIATQRDAGLLDCATLACAAHAGRGARDNLMADPTFNASTTGNLKGGWVPLGTGSTIEAGGQSGGKRAVVSYSNGLAWRYPAGNLKSFEITAYVQPVSGSTASQVRIQVQQGPSGGSTYQNRSALGSFSVPAGVWTRIRAIGRTDPRGGDLTIRPWVQNSSQGDVRYSDFRVSRI